MTLLSSAQTPSPATTKKMASSQEVPNAQPENEVEEVLPHDPLAAGETADLVTPAESGWEEADPLALDHSPAREDVEVNEETDSASESSLAQRNVLASDATLPKESVESTVPAVRMPRTSLDADAIPAPRIKQEPEMLIDSDAVTDGYLIKQEPLEELEDNKADIQKGLGLAIGQVFSLNVKQEPEPCKPNEEKTVKPARSLLSKPFYSMIKKKRMAKQTLDVDSDFLERFLLKPCHVDVSYRPEEEFSEEEEDDDDDAFNIYANCDGAFDPSDDEGDSDENMAADTPDSDTMIIKNEPEDIPEDDDIDPFMIKQEPIDGDFASGPLIFNATALENAPVLLPQQITAKRPAVRPGPGPAFGRKEAIPCDVPTCSETFTDKDGLLVHMVFFHMRHYCLLCGMLFKNGQDKSLHMVLQHDAHPCTTCRKPYSSVSELGLHCFEEHEIFQCPFCGYIVPEQSLKLHIEKSHQMEYWRFKAHDVLGKAYQVRRTLKVRMFLQTKKKLSRFLSS